MLRSSLRRQLPALVRWPARLVVYWAPVWIPLALLAQIGLLGLKPARAERERLKQAAQQVEARHAASQGRYQELLEQESAFQDEVFRERWRRKYLAEQDK